MLRCGGADGVQHGDGGGERKGQLLLRRRTRLLQMVGADVHRVELRRLAIAPDNHVRDQPQARPRRKDVGPPGQVFLDQVVLGGALQDLGVRPLLFRQGHIERQQPGRRGIDGHGGVHPRQGDLVEQGPHVPQMADGHADLADLPPGEDMVGVVAGLGRQVEGDGEPGLALVQIGPVQAVGHGRGGVSRIGAEDPRRVPPGLCLRSGPICHSRLLAFGRLGGDPGPRASPTIMLHCKICACQPGKPITPSGSNVLSVKGLCDLDARIRPSGGTGMGDFT